MADAIVSTVIEELTSIIAREIEQNVRLVVGVRNEVKMLTTKFRDIKAVLDDAEKRQFKEEGVRRGIAKLKDISFDMDDVLDEWSTAIGKSLIKGDEESVPKSNNKVRFLTYFPCFRCREVGLRHDIALEIKDLNQRFDLIVNEQLVFKFSLQKETAMHVERPITTSFIDVEEVKGREEEKGVIISKLLTESSHTPNPHIISIVGMGGIGKTTLVTLAYTDNVVKAHFEKRMWVCVSDPYEEIRVAKAILESLQGSPPNLVELQSIMQQIQQSLGGKKFLLVLDDVWEENSAKWEQLKRRLKCGSAGSRILVTSRKEIAARAIGCTDIYHIGQLSEENCWLLFRQIAFFGWGNGEWEHLEDIGRKIVSKCKGLRLAVKSLGGLLCSKRSRNEWQSILEIAEVDLFPHLWLSYFDLAPPLRQCFSYCAIFPKDYQMKKQRVIESWMDNGYLRESQRKDMETLGEEYFQNLASRSFFQELHKDVVFDRIESCKMHDIVHDFAQYISRNECFRMEVGESIKLDSFCKEFKRNPL